MTNTISGFFQTTMRVKVRWYGCVGLRCRRARKRTSGASPKSTTDKALELMVVTDADDASVPAQLLTVTLR